MEAQDIEEEKFFSEEDRKKRGLSDGFFLPWFEGLFSPEKSGELVGKRELDRMEIRNGEPFAEKVLFEQFELSGFS